MNKQMRGMISGLEIRATDDDTRTVEFIAATENGVDTYYGREFLDMNGADLTRYRKNPVILDAHTRGSAVDVIGKSELVVEGNKLAASVTFAETERAEDVWKLVRGGFINALSVGFVPRVVTKVDENSEAELNGQEITGPARIVDEWELFEISVVPVPADSEALRREYEAGEKNEENFNRVFNLLTDIKEKSMSEEKEIVEEVIEEEVVEEEETVEERHAEYFAITPRGYEYITDRCIIQGKTLEETQQELLDAVNEIEEEKKRAAALAPIGVEEPVEIEKRNAPLTKKDIIG